MIEWISVSEGLPDTDRLVLVWRNIYHGGEDVEKDVYRGEWLIYSSSPISHWAEINPPAEKQCQK